MRVAVVGAGLAGLACAVDLARAGVDVTVYEANDRVGGRAWSDAMPDGARFERGGEFIETGYDHFCRRAAEYGLELTAHGFEFAAREVRAGGRVWPTLLLEAEAALAASLASLGTDAASISAADALERTPLGSTRAPGPHAPPRGHLHRGARARLGVLAGERRDPRGGGDIRAALRAPGRRQRCPRESARGRARRPRAARLPGA